MQKIAYHKMPITKMVAKEDSHSIVDFNLFEPQEVIRDLQVEPARLITLEEL